MAFQSNDDNRKFTEVYNIEIYDLNYTLFDSKGEIGKMHQLFRVKMNGIINELN
jgi:hypothetical protein